MLTDDVSTCGFIGSGGMRGCMDHPDLVRSRLDGERVLTRVGLGGDDAVLVTPTRTLVYRAEGLLSDESVSAYPHDVERVELRSGRRKATFRLVYVDEAKDLTVPSRNTHEVLVPLLTGVLRAADVVEADEAVRGAYRFSELTLVVTDRRVVKHVGGAVWDEEFEVAPYADLTGLGFEEGSVATEISLEVAGYPQRVKVPNEHAGTVRRAIQEGAFGFHGVSSHSEFEAAVAPAPDEGEEDEESEDDDLVGSGFTTLLGDEDGDGREPGTGATGATADEGGDDHSGPEPGPPETDEGDGRILDPVSEDSTAFTGVESGEPGATRSDGSARATGEEIPPEVADRLAELTAAVERQNELLERQGEVVRRLVEELRRGR